MKTSSSLFKEDTTLILPELAQALRNVLNGKGHNDAAEVLSRYDLMFTKGGPDIKRKEKEDGDTLHQ